MTCEKADISERRGTVEVEWHETADPPVYLIRTVTDSGREQEVYLEPEEIEQLSEFYEATSESDNPGLEG